MIEFMKIVKYIVQNPKIIYIKIYNKTKSNYNNTIAKNLMIIKKLKKIKINFNNNNNWIKFKSIKAYNINKIIIHRLITNMNNRKLMFKKKRNKI